MRPSGKNLLLPALMLFFSIVSLSPSDVLGDAGDPTMIRLQRKNIRASSVLVENGRPPSYYAAERALDGKINTAWCASQDDPAPTFEVEFAPAPLKAIHIFGGYGANIGLCRHNNRIKDYELTFILTSGKTVTVRGKLNDECETSFHMAYELYDNPPSIEEWCKNPCYDKTCPEKDPKKVQECIRTQEMRGVQWVGSGGGGAGIVGRVSPPKGNEEFLCVKGIKLKVLSVYPGRGKKGTCDTCISEIVVSLGFMGDEEREALQNKCK